MKWLMRTTEMRLPNWLWLSFFVMSTLNAMLAIFNHWIGPALI